MHVKCEMAGVHDRRRRQIFPEAQSSVRLLLSPLDQANHVPELVGRDSVHVAADRARGEADSVLPIGHVGKWHVSTKEIGGIPKVRLRQLHQFAAVVGLPELHRT